MLCGTTGLRFPAVGLAWRGAAAAAAVAAGAGAGAAGCNLRYVRWWRQDERSGSFVSCPTDSLALTSSHSLVLPPVQPLVS